MSALPDGWTERAPRVICVGLTAMDHIWTVGHVPQEAGKFRAPDYTSGGGGMAATAAAAIARLGGRAEFWGRAGFDAAGLAMKRELEIEDVDVAHFRLFKDARSSVSGVLVDQAGERMIVNFRGESLPEDPDWLPLDRVGAAGAVLADPRWIPGVIAAFTAARAKGVPTVLDADISDAAVFEALLPLADHAVFSEQGLRAFTGDDDGLRRVAEYGCRIAAVTRGERGVDWLEDGARHHRPAFAVRAVNTSGAGDVFHGAWAMAIAAGAQPHQAADFASAAAALKCTRAGGRDAIPDLDETMDFWRTAR